MAGSVAGEDIYQVRTVVTNKTVQSVMRPADAGVHDRVVNKTFITYMGDQCHPWVTAFNPVAGTFDAPVQCGTASWTEKHLYPVILQDANGYLHVFYHGDECPLRYSVSTNPRDASAWTNRDATIGGTNKAFSADYTSACQTADGTIYVFFHDTSDLFAIPSPGATLPYDDSSEGLYRLWAFVKSTDGGATWSDMVRIVDLIDRPNNTNPEVYSGGVFHENGRMHLAWTRSGGNFHAQQNEDLYYAYMDATNDHMYAADGTDLGPTITDSEAEAHCKVLNTATGSREVMTLCAVCATDADGKPIVAFKTYEQVKTARWTDSAWAISSALYTNTNSDDKLWGIDLEKLAADADLDTDGDGLTPRQEFVFGSDPSLQSSVRRPVGVVHEDTGTGERYLALTYSRRKTLLWLEVVVEVSTDLVEWHSGAAYTTTVQVSDNGDGTESVLERMLTPMSDIPRAFLRTRIQFK